jgi:hypothetical protein
VGRRPGVVVDGRRRRSTVSLFVLFRWPPLLKKECRGCPFPGAKEHCNRFHTLPFAHSTNFVSAGLTKRPCHNRAHNCHCGLHHRMESSPMKLPLALCGWSTVSTLLSIRFLCRMPTIWRPNAENGQNNARPGWILFPFPYNNRSRDKPNTFYLG